MASESSSAVLDLNDADTEETEAPSVIEDVREGDPLIMEHGQDIAVKVDAPLKQLSTLETFVTYRVRCVCARWPTPPHVRRRYNHFKVLHKRLSAAHPWVPVPPLPPLHSVSQQLDRYSPAFVAIRTVALNAFMDRVAKHPILTHSEDFHIFLTTPDNEIEKVLKNENSALNLWGLSSALYSSNTESKLTNGARVKDPEFSSAAEYLSCLQQKLLSLSSLTTKLYTNSAALATELLGMKRACDAWCCQSRGGLARACSAVGTGAGAQHAALSKLRPPIRMRATLPLLAAYAGVLQDKIGQRDNLHAVHISAAGGSASGADEAQNRLTVASEALRCDLADWTPKTRAEVKQELLDLATKRVTTLTQILMGWEHALKLSTEANVEDLFKTVSKTAVLNLSPSKCKADVTPTETERDFDDLEIYSDSDFQEIHIQDSDKEELEPKPEEHDISNQEGVITKQENEIIDSQEIEIVNNKKENDVSDVSKLESISNEAEVISDPLQSFSVVDLSS